MLTTYIITAVICLSSKLFALRNVPSYAIVALGHARPLPVRGCPSFSTF